MFQCCFDLHPFHAFGLTKNMEELMFYVYISKHLMHKIMIISFSCCRNCGIWESVQGMLLGWSHVWPNCSENMRPTCIINLLGCWTSFTEWCEYCLFISSAISQQTPLGMQLDSKIRFNFKYIKEICIFLRFVQVITSAGYYFGKHSYIFIWMCCFRLLKIEKSNWVLINNMASSCAPWMGSRTMFIMGNCFLGHLLLLLNWYKSSVFMKNWQVVECELGYYCISFGLRKLVCQFVFLSPFGSIFVVTISF